MFLSKVRSNNRQEKAFKKGYRSEESARCSPKSVLISPDIGEDWCGLKVGSGADRCANSARLVRLVSPPAILCRLVIYSPNQATIVEVWKY